MRIAFYGNFGAGNLGNECTLQAIIEQVLQFEPAAQLLCFCTNPEDVQMRHQIKALPSAVIRVTAAGAVPGENGRLKRFSRILFRWLPLELVQWVRTIGPMSRTDVFMVAGTGIVADYLSGTLGYPYDIFRLSILAAILRTKVVFLSVGVGPIDRPLSRWFFKRALGIAHFRSYRDKASRDCLEKIGFDTNGDAVCPDVVFGLAQDKLPQRTTGGGQRTIGLGLKDYGSADMRHTGSRHEYMTYLRTMADFVSWLHAHGYSVRLLIGDMHYDTPVITEFIALLAQRGVATDKPWLLVEPVSGVGELLGQIADTEAVISARYHNLVMGLIQGKPVMALSDHAKLDSLVSDFGLARYRLALATLTPEGLIDRFKELQNDSERLRPFVRAGVDRYRQELGRHYTFFFESLGAAVPSARSVT